jgi:hypothetical protein
VEKCVEAKTVELQSPHHQKQNIKNKMDTVLFYGVVPVPGNREFYVLCTVLFCSFLPGTAGSAERDHF